MKGMVVQFRRGRHRYKPRHFLIEIEGISKREEAEKLTGMDVEWKSPGRKRKLIRGKIRAAHGNKGLVRAIFEKGLPGQAITTEVEIKGEIKKEKIKKTKKEKANKKTESKTEKKKPEEKI